MLRNERERNFPDHVGVHRVLIDSEGRRFDYLLGVPGEVGEGLPFRGSIRLASGRSARLVGTGETWIVVWAEPPPCRQSAVVAGGMPRAKALGLLRGAGLLASRPT